MQRRALTPLTALLAALGLVLTGCSRTAPLQIAPVAKAVAAPASATVSKAPQPVITEVIDGEAVPGEVIVRFKDAARELPGATRKTTLGLPNTYVYQVKDQSYAVQAAEEWTDADDIDYVEPNYIYHAVGATNDPMGDQSWGVGAIQAPSLWPQSQGAGVKVAVIDTGVNASHPDLAGRVTQGYDVVNKDNDATDDHGHGTHVAGTIAAVANNGIGVAGVAPDATIIPIKVLSARGSGTNEGIADGIVKAVELGAKVINMSLGGPDNSETLKRAIAYAQARGVVVIAAAGNDNVSKPFYPAANADVIAVAATDPQGRKADFSNFGDYVDIAAPGTNIVSTGYQGNYVSMSGTSMAAPHVAGVAALLLGAHPNLKAAQIQRVMQTSGKAATGFAMTPAPQIVSVPGAFARVPALDLVPPSRVIGVNATAGAPGEIELSWAPASDNLAVAGYRLLRDGEIVDTTGKTGYTDRGLVPGKAYAYTVVAFDIDGNEAPASLAASGSAGAPSEVYEDVVVTKRSSNSLTIAWTTRTPVKGRLEWGTDAKLGEVTAAATEAGTSHSVTLTGLSRFKKYYFRVKGTDNAGAVHYSETKNKRTKLWWLFSVQ